MQHPITFGGGGTEIPESFDNGKNSRVGQFIRGNRRIAAFFIDGHATGVCQRYCFARCGSALITCFSDYISQDLEDFFGTYLKMSKARLCVFCMQNPNLLVCRLMGSIQMTGFVLHDMPEEEWG